MKHHLAEARFKQIGTANHVGVALIEVIDCRCQLIRDQSIPTFNYEVTGYSRRMLFPKK